MADAQDGVAGLDSRSDAQHGRRAANSEIALRQRRQHCVEYVLVGVSLPILSFLATSSFGELTRDTPFV